MNTSASGGCHIDGCGRPIRNKSLELCNRHYLKHRRHGDPLHQRPPAAKTKPCIIDGCNLRQCVRGLCSKHEYRRLTHGSPHVTSFHVEKHGMTDHPLYATWLNMRRRCNSPTSDVYSHYGARGISVCDRWSRSFSTFVADVGERPGPSYSLDRIDNTGNYEPGNVRWANKSVQAKNQRNRIDNTSGHRGVCWDKGRRLWRAYVGGGRSRRELGHFSTFTEAVDARHAATSADMDIHCCELMALQRLCA